MLRALLVLVIGAGALAAEHLDDARAAADAVGLPGLIAYTAPARGPLDVNQELFVVDARGGKPRRLTANGAYDGTPRFSPSGERVAVTRTVSYGRPARRASGIVVVGLNGRERTVLRYTQLGGTSEWPRWSPDGRWIGFQRLRGARRPGPVELWVVRPDGSGLRRLPVDGAFNNLDINSDAGEQAWDWSPDGRRIAFQRRDPLTQGDDEGDIAVAEIASGRQRIIAAGRHPVWSPRRDEIAFVNQDLYVARADGGGVRRVTTFRGVPVNPSWSPDGRRIAFVAQFGTDSRATAVYVVNRDGSGLRRLVRCDIGQPRWSRDGAWIACSDARAGSILRVSSRGGRPVRVARPGIHLGWGLDWR